MVYNKHEMEIIGFVDLGSGNNTLREVERSIEKLSPCSDVATHTLVLIVRDLTSQLRLPTLTSPRTDQRRRIRLCRLCGKLLNFWSALAFRSWQLHVTALDPIAIFFACTKA